MGLDEALLLSGGATPTLRLYTWSPDALSLGYFQALEDVPAARDHPCVLRRITGGGAIHHHAGELTFSVTIARDDPAYRGTVAASYASTHRAVALALERLGARGARERRSEACASDRDGTGMCFHDSTPMDVGWDAGVGFQKGVGTAQRRTGGRILHHGSIKVSPSPLEPGVATLAETPGANAEIGALARELIGAFGEVFGVSIEPTTFHHQLDREAKRLGARYVSEAFVHRQVRRRVPHP